MANISIHTRCNRECDYCFARESLDAAEEMPASISFGLFDRILDFLERSRIEEVRLLGGEPTLHPRFPGLVERAAGRGFNLLVFSNGLIPDAALQCLSELPADRVRVLINAAEPRHSDRHTVERQQNTMSVLGSRTMLGVNVYKPDLGLAYLLDYIQNFHLVKRIRLGLAHPVFTGHNRFLHPRYYSAVGKTIAGFAREAEGMNVTLEFDCGFVPCMFPSDFFRAKNGLSNVGMRCNPILDILPDGSVISCYPLCSVHQEALPATRNADWLREKFENALLPYRVLSVFKECADCPLKDRGYCLGGCLAASMRRLRSSGFVFTESKPD